MIRRFFLMPRAQTARGKVLGAPLRTPARGTFPKTPGRLSLPGYHAERTATRSCERGGGTIFSDAVIAASILDRLLHHSTINIRGESYRLKDRRRAGLITGREQEEAQRGAPGAVADGLPPRRRAAGVRREV